MHYPSHANSNHLVGTSEVTHALELLAAPKYLQILHSLWRTVMQL